jgi:aryl-alcohol dehydrogenase-like predicted oxidoreductase
LVNRISREKGATPAQIALAWLLARGPSFVPIPGTTKEHRLVENIGAADIELTPGEVEEIDSASAQIEIVGKRYHEAMMKMVGR